MRFYIVTAEKFVRQDPRRNYKYNMGPKILF